MFHPPMFRLVSCTKPTPFPRPRVASTEWHICPRPRTVVSQQKTDRRNMLYLTELLLGIVRSRHEGRESGWIDLVAARERQALSRHVPIIGVDAYSSIGISVAVLVFGRVWLRAKSTLRKSNTPRNSSQLPSAPDSSPPLPLIY